MSHAFVRPTTLAACVLGLTLGTLSLSGCEVSGREADSARSTAAAVAVQVSEVSARDEARTITAAGSLRASKSATLAARVMGSVLEIRKNAGDEVHRGEVLLVIDPREVSGQISQAEGALAQAQAALALAEANYTRFEGLHGRGSASDLEFDQARFQRDTARGAVQQAEGAAAAARSYRAYTEVAAPFNGRVVDRLAEVGDLAAPGRPLLTLEDATNTRLFVTLAEDELRFASVGANVSVRVPALSDLRVEGRVTEVVPGIDAATHSFTVKIDLPSDPALRSGLYARAEFQSDSRSVLRVPRSAIVRRGGLTGVFVTENGNAAFRLLLLADDAADEPEVLSGLESGARVVLNPPATLEEGSSLEVRS